MPEAAHIRRSQGRVITFLKDPASHGTGDPVRIVETHGALIFLVGSAAYKMKRAVTYDYMDLSTLKLRHDMLLRELALNQPAAPQIYRDVVPVTRAGNGGLALNGSGEPVEWLLSMARFPAEAELTYIADHGLLSEAMAQALGRSVARYHQHNPRRDDVGDVLIREIIDELNDAFAKMTDTLTPDLVAGFRRGIEPAFDAIRALLRQRGSIGQVRRCHGDLHLRNIVLLDGVPTPYDALEFDERLGTCDVLYDLAFLLMDLGHRGLNHQANLVFNSYLFTARDASHEPGLAALPLFLSIRAAILAMVDVQRARLIADPVATLADARHYLTESLAFLTPAPVRLVAIGGLSGTGKTTLSRALAHRIGAAPGAVHLRSDLERKAALGADPLASLPAEAYNARASEKVYGLLRDKARRILSAGHSVILDAAHLTKRHRDATDATAAVAADLGCDFVGLWLDADTDTLIRRVETRRGDASDATSTVVRAQAARPLGPIGWQRLDCSGPFDATVQAAAALISVPT